LNELKDFNVGDMAVRLGYNNAATMAKELGYTYTDANGQIVGNIIALENAIDQIASNIQNEFDKIDKKARDFGVSDYMTASYLQGIDSN
jgi:uncharacterized membrane protein YqgA involved in biofilm formation